MIGYDNMEVWKKSVSYYEVSNTGKIRNMKTQRILKQQKYTAPEPHQHTDMRVRLYGTEKDSTRGKTFKVHILVAKAFLGDYSSDLEIDHLDGDPTNNHIDNLKICTHKENMNNPVTLKKFIKNI